LPSGITHSNKDVMFKVLSRNYKDKSFAVYGLDLPRVKQLLPTNYPAVTATEIHAENAFLLEDGSLLVLEYESNPGKKDFWKYNRREYSKMVKRWIKITKVARLFEEEKIEAVIENEKTVRKQIAREMLATGDDILKVMLITRLTRAEVDELRVSVGV